MNNRKSLKLKLIVLGDKGIGKTTLIQNYIPSIYSYKEIENKYTFIKEIDSVPIRITIYEFSERNENVINKIKNCYCILILFDMANRTSFENLLDNWLLFLRDTCHFKGLVIVFGKHYLHSNPLKTGEDEIKEMIRVSEVKCQFYNIGKNKIEQSNEIINNLIEDAFEMPKKSQTKKSIHFFYSKIFKLLELKILFKKCITKKKSYF